MKKNIFLVLTLIFLVSCGQEEHEFGKQKESDEIGLKTALSISGPSTLYSDGEGFYVTDGGITNVEILNTNKVKFYPIGGGGVGSYARSMYVDLRGLDLGTSTLKFTFNDNTILTKDITIIRSDLTGRYYKQSTRQWTNFSSTGMGHYIPASGNDNFILEFTPSDPNATFEWYSLGLGSNISKENGGKRVRINYSEGAWENSDCYLLKVTTNGGIFKRLFTFGVPVSRYENQNFPFKLPQTNITGPDKLYPGSKYQFELANGETAIWSASPTVYVSIDPSSGLLTNHSPFYRGNITISARSESGTTYTKEIRIEGEYMDGAFSTGGTERTFSDRFPSWPVYDIGYNYSNMNQPSIIKIYNPPGTCTWTVVEKVLPLESWSSGSWYYVRAYNGGRATILLEIQTSYGIMEQLFHIN